MQTKFWQLTTENRAQVFEEAGALIRAGELVAFPTETVYGLGANGLDGRAVGRIYEAKGRPSDNPLILHIANLDEIYPLTSGLSPMAVTLAKKFWPGPMTLVVPKSDIIPEKVTAGLDTVAVRLPVNEDARKFIQAAGVPIAAPSANLSGKPSPTTAADVLTDMDGRIAAIIDGGACDVGLESTVIDTTGAVPTILRPGGITPQMIEEALGKVEIDKGLSDPSQKPKAPGMKYKHYAPKAEMHLCRSEVTMLICVTKDLAAGRRVGVIHTQPIVGCENRVYRSLEELANKLFYYLRDLDRSGVDVIYGLTVPEEGIGLAIMNRMKKSCGGSIL